MPRRRRHLVKRAVHAVADLELRLERLEVDVTRAVLDRLREHEVHVADDRRGIRLALDFLHVERPAFAAKLYAAAKLRQDRVEARRIGAVVLRDQIIDLVDRRDDGMHILADGKTQILDRLRIQRVHERDLQHVVLVAERKGAVKLRQPGWQELQQIRRRHEVLQVHILRPDRIRDGVIVAILIDRLVVHQHFAQRLSSARDLLQDVIHDSRVHGSLFDEYIECLSCVHG